MNNHVHPLFAKILNDAAGVKPRELLSTVAGQYTLVDLGAGAAFQYHWIETIKSHGRTIAAFALQLDAMQLLAHYQARETEEALR